MTLTEAAACGTPAVATRIAGHADAVRDGRSGLLAEHDIRAASATPWPDVLGDDDLRARLDAARSTGPPSSRGATRRPGSCAWSPTRSQRRRRR